MQHSQEALHAYVDALFSKFSGKGSVTVAGTGIKQNDTWLEFIGHQPGMRGQARYVIPFDSRRPGVIAARSILKGRVDRPMDWLFNGQALSGCTQIAHIGAGSGELTLHVSLRELEAWSMEPFERAKAAGGDIRDGLEEWCRAEYARRAATGLYAEEPGLGSLHDRDGHDTLQLEIEPVNATPSPAP